jgi:hypothetical protein
MATADTAADTAAGAADTAVSAADTVASDTVVMVAGVATGLAAVMRVTTCMVTEVML